ncbi:MAG TPA: EamA family transporter [Candidatus Limnocylindria bacterium]|nr:EamA family transporter [Candidatus Limnocylindria bacterium]
MRRPDTTVLLVFALVVLVGGSNFVAVRFSNRELPPFYGAGIRFVGASLLLLALSRAMRLSLPRGRPLAGALAFGTINFGVTYALTYWGLQTAPAALASTLAALTPLFTFLGAVALRDEPFRWRGIAGGGIAVAGIAVIFLEQVHEIPTAALVALALQPVAIAAGTIWAKRLPRAHPVATNAVAMAPGAALLLAIAAVAREPAVVPARTETWIALAYLVVSSGVLFVGFFYVVRRWTASATSYAVVLFPVVTLAVGAALAHEGVSAAFILGAVLVVAGVYVGALAPARSAAAT